MTSTEELLLGIGGMLLAHFGWLAWRVRRLEQTVRRIRRQQVKRDTSMGWYSSSSRSSRASSEIRAAREKPDPENDGNSY